MGVGGGLIIRGGWRSWVGGGGDKGKVGGSNAGRGILVT